MRAEQAALRAVGTASARFSDKEVEEFRAFATQPNVYQRICKSVAPSIWGADDIKAAVSCLLFGGSRKR